ncbi:uncharacterized protein [Mytilus edulis]|uniref:uncharacterized protein n=1 Tax=Mytilus edulis TaxID=6550 RepID=UPI0039EF69F2
MFNGEILTWQTFWDSFESSVHYNVTLTDVQKFSYLKSQLVNDAARTIDGLPLTNSNYMEAIKLLKERFGQSHKITNAYMQAMLELRAPQNNLLSLRGYYDKLEAYIRGLESLGRSGESYGALLIPIILNKLPSEIRQHLARENGSDNWELIDLRRGILKEITIIEAGQRSSSFMDSMQPTTMTASFLTCANRKCEPSKVVTFDNRERQTQNIRQKPCIFCQNLHDPAKCPNVTDHDTRLSIVKEKKLCFNCLGSHRSVDCKSKYRCRQCHQKHHTSLCHGNICTNDQLMSVNAVVDDSENTLIAASFHSSEEKSRSNVLLKTAVAPVGGNRYVDTHILFDEGAQRSFVTEELASKIDLEILGTETIHLSAFESTDSKVRHLSRARVYVESINRTKIPVEVLVVPNIASPLSNYIGNGIREFKYLKGLRLAHPFTEDNSSFEISLLIGADFYWDFVEDTILRGNGPTAVKSKLGYLLSGPIPTSYRQQSNVGMYNILTSHKPEELNLERFWELESLGVDSNTTDVETVDYMETNQKSAIEFRENKYIAKLPWKPNHEPLPTNFFVTKRRTENVIRKLSQDPEMLKVYGQIIKDQERRGFIEKVKDPDISKGIVHYIPHHPVKKK